MTTTRPRRRGAAMVMALVCLLLVTMLCGAMLKLAHTRRRASRVEEHRMQAEWLAESGVARASARLDAVKDYKGETWEVPATAFGPGSSQTGRVKIEVEPIDKAPDRRRVRVVADFPSNDPQRARQSKQLTVDLRGGSQ